MPVAKPKPRARTTAAPRQQRQKLDDGRILVKTYRRVPVESLKQYDKNPRRGNLKAIAESLRENGQYRTVVVRPESHEILAGNHTWKVIKDILGWTHVDVEEVQIEENGKVRSLSDEESAKVVLADNRTNDLASYDPEMLSDILSNRISDPVGTGYTAEDLDLILKASKDNDLEAFQGVIHPPSLGDSDLDEFASGEPLDDTDLSSHGKPVDDDIGGFESASDDTGTVFQLKEDMVFDTHSKWGLPEIRRDMLVEQLPSPLAAWAGSATRDWPDPDQWWLYNYGIDSTSGMNDVSRIILSFYCWDEYFDSWWYNPGALTTRTLNSGVTMAVMPNFSQWPDEPKALSLYSLYRSRWLGRYFQEAGIKIIPDLNWRFGDQEWLERYTLPGIPKKLPIVAFQMQTFDPKNTSKDDLVHLGDCIRLCYEKLEPEELLLYSGKPGLDFHTRLKLPWKITHIENRLTKLGEQAKNRTKKTTL